jgi:hypothetical protein
MRKVRVEPAMATLFRWKRRSYGRTEAAECGRSQGTWLFSYSKGSDVLVALATAALLLVEPGFCREYGVLEEIGWVDPVLLHWRSLLQVISEGYVLFYSSSFVGIYARLQQPT